MLVGKINEADVKSSKNAFSPNDVLFGKLRPYLRKCVLTQEEGVCSTDILIFTPKYGFNSEFVVSLLHTPGLLEHAIKTTSGVNHPRTSWNSLKVYRFGLPSKEERDEIAQLLLILENKSKNSEHKRTLLEQLFRTLLHQLMTGEVRTADDADLGITLIPSEQSA